MVEDVATPGIKDSQRTRQAILHAAQDAFSTRGYLATSVRDITARAGVSVALVSRYFGSKERLFEDALSDMLGASRIVAIEREQFGEAICELLLHSVGPRSFPLPMIAMASGDPGARAIAERLLLERVYIPLSNWFGPVRGRERAARFMIISAGLTIYQRLYPLDVVEPRLSPSLRAWLVAEFQGLAE